MLDRLVHFERRRAKERAQVVRAGLGALPRDEAVPRDALLVGAVLNQQRGDAVARVLRRIMKRRHAKLVGHVDVRARIDQDAHRVEVAPHGSEMQRALADGIGCVR